MEKLYIGVGYHIVCLDKNSGNIIWKTKLKKSEIVNCYLDEDLVFAHAGGCLYCLDIVDGRIKWENGLKGLGYGACVFAGASQQNQYLQKHKASQNAAAAGT